MLRAGAATKIITNELGTIIQAAGHEQTASRVRDELEANVLYLADENARVLLINCDVVAFDSPWAIDFRRHVADGVDVPERNVIICCTHTHTGPCVIPSNPFRHDYDEPWHLRVKEWLLEAAREAVENAAPCRIGHASGKAVIGYNRRCCWSDGSHSMFGDVTRDDFTGIEGPHDDTHATLFAETLEGEFIAVVHNNSAHPTNFYGRDFYSSDYPGLARKLLRDALGNIPILYLNGGIGDNTPQNLFAPKDHQRDSEANYHRQAFIAAGETLRLIHEAHRDENPVLKHVHEDLRLPVRLPDETKLLEDRKILDEALADESKREKRMPLFMAHGRLRLMEAYKDDPFDTVSIHALRVGGCALATNPCELYGQFMIDVRRRSPFATTMFSDLADGYCGYCPTMSGALTGGYSGEAILWTRLSLDAGYRIVDAAAKLLNQIHDRSS